MARRKGGADGKPRATPAGFKPLVLSGFCAFPTTGAKDHGCTISRCICECHKEAK